MVCAIRTASFQDPCRRPKAIGAGRAQRFAANGAAATRDFGI